MFGLPARFVSIHGNLRNIFGLKYHCFVGEESFFAIMLKKLTLNNIGPSSRFGPIEFAPRLNIITGDNGLGKSFLLDTAWWAMTRSWARDFPAYPTLSQNNSSIEFTLEASTKKDYSYTSRFDRLKQTWSTKMGRPPIPGIVLYAAVDGSFSVWDPARNYWLASQNPDRPRCFNFKPENIWDGLRDERGVNHCNGLNRDWVSWQIGRTPEFEELVRVLSILSSSETEKLTPGKPVRMGISVEDYPSIKMPYGQEVPLPMASAGIRRIAALAYLLVWTWSEHKKACQQLGNHESEDIVFLIDEIECHLHPQWQRRIIPSLLGVMSALTQEKVSVQLIAATHSPLILASAEPDFDVDQDATFNIKLSPDGMAEIFKEPWVKQGDVTNWLVSEAFGLKQARSVAAERAIEAAEALMRNRTDLLPEDLNTYEKIHRRLIEVLTDHDAFWPRWIVNTQFADHGSN